MNALKLHRILEQNTGLLIFGILFISSIGGLVQILPSLNDETLSTPTMNTRVYDAVELTGRDIYIREGCHVCHSQQIRPLVAEVERYGPYSRSGEFVYDRPFLWGSKRTGPDLHRIGGKYSDQWHETHLLNPRAVVPESIMPAYPWLSERPASAAGDIQRKMQVLQSMGHPYSPEDINNAEAALQGLTEMEALIRYLQMLGTSFDASQADAPMEGM
ncbi:MAG: cytochrome-c oxidase, cbb3-type subunit II [Gammaproteobacteria bacterium]|nr:cytochrome-c oxidase, cbb3-type subunit II [Gammaproteobacteria bacterium]|tara:strand:- start:61590 stop:62237 length:648 start_codon:yes stop_codon:yes gene_type:complete